MIISKLEKMNELKKGRMPKSDDAETRSINLRKILDETHLRAYLRHFRFVDTGHFIPGQLLSQHTKHCQMASQQIVNQKI